MNLIFLRDGGSENVCKGKTSYHFEKKSVFSLKKNVKYHQLYVNYSEIVNIFIC